MDCASFSKLTGMKITMRRDEGLIEDYDLSSNFDPLKHAYDISRLTGDPLDRICARLPQHSSLMRGRRDRFVKSWEDYKLINGLNDFTDMLSKYVNTGLDPLKIKVAFLDEAQDLSMLQWAAFHKLVANAERIYIAGDDDQGIYGFMGGSEFGFFHEPADQEEVLRTSYRVPEVIGLRAERIIRRIKERKEKEIEWKHSQGQLAHVSLPVTALPWRGWLDAGKSVLVLSRHRRKAVEFSTELSSIAIPHSVGGWTAHNSPLAKVVRDYLTMRHGEVLPWRRVHKILVLAQQDELAATLKRRGALDKKLELDRTTMNFGWDDPEWPTLFAHQKGDLKRIKHLERLIAKEGVDLIGRDPQVQVMTMHASKGREADVVVMSPDCNQTVQDRLMTPSEIRLAYVALTRAKEKAIILAPDTGKFISHLVGA